MPVQRRGIVAIRRQSDAMRHRGHGLVATDLLAQAVNAAQTVGGMVRRVVLADRPSRGVAQKRRIGAPLSSVPFREPGVGEGRSMFPIFGPHGCRDRWRGLILVLALPVDATSGRARRSIRALVGKYASAARMTGEMATGQTHLRQREWPLGIVRAAARLS